MREIGKEMSEKSKGLFSPEDWNCKSCGNINWARRNTCNVCNTPRVSNSGQRTGYGGGYMERDEVVEYRDRGDSDDEFDEFGRKKKKFRKTSDDRQNGALAAGQTSTSSRTESSSSRLERASEKHRNEDEHINKDIPNAVEEEEDSGDDADLSKYDIWGAEDDESDTEKEKAKIENPSTDKKAAKDLTKASPTSSHSASGSESDSDASSSSGSSSPSSSSSSSAASSSSSVKRGSRGLASRSRSPDSSGRMPRRKTGQRQASPRDGGEHERSRFELAAALTWVLSSAPSKLIRGSVSPICSCSFMPLLSFCHISVTPTYSFLWGNISSDIFPRSLIVLGKIPPRLWTASYDSGELCCVVRFVIGWVGSVVNRVFIALPDQTAP